MLELLRVEKPLAFLIHYNPYNESEVENMLTVIEGVSWKAFSEGIGKKNTDAITGIGITEEGNVDVMLDAKLSWQMKTDTDADEVKFYALNVATNRWEVRFTLKSNEFVKISIL